MTLRDNKSRTTLKKPIISRTPGPMIRTQVMNTRITMILRAVYITLALIQNGGLYTHDLF
jgi:hypothetical protein